MDRTIKHNIAAQTTIDLKPTTKKRMLLSKHKTSKNSGAKKTKKKKDCTNKLKRPLSAYNIFFQHQREKIVTNNPSTSLDDVLLKI